MNGFYLIASYKQNGANYVFAMGGRHLSQAFDAPICNVRAIEEINEGH